MPQTLVVANWKMNGSLAFAESMAKELLSSSLGLNGVRVVICAPSVYIASLAALLQNSNIEIGGQDISEQASGAYTGEISGDMLSDVGGQWAIIGHSERRTYHAESDEQVVAKTAAALEAGLKPICCVGETMEQRESGETEAVVARQVSALVDAFSIQRQLSKLVIAYEPVWAIGTGLTATPEQAQEVHAYIRGLLGSDGQEISILYGGSVKPESAADLLSQPDIDGGLIGGASLVSKDFIEICRAAENN